MATKAQLVANQANAQLSTGPKSREGKARVAQNAVTHGLTAKGFVVRDDEHEEFEALRAGLLADIKPEGALETATFEQLFHAAWNLHRFRRIEAEASLGTLDDFTDPETAGVLDRLSRYQAREQRAYYRALQELKALQTNRANRNSTLAVPDDEPNVPSLTDIARWTKQTQLLNRPRAVKAQMEEEFAEIAQMAADAMAEHRRRKAEEAA
jgi:hypothetical protein